MRPCDGNCLFDDRGCLRSQAISFEVVRIDELGGRDVGTMNQHAADRTAEIVDQHVVIAYLAFGVEQDAVEHIHDGADFDLESGLFEHFPRKPSLEGFSEFEPTTRKTPLPGQRLEPPLDDDNLAVLNDDGADTDDRLAGVLPR